MWHRLPKDDAWKQVTPASIKALGQGLWIHCACGRNRVEDDPLAFADQLGLDQCTPLHRIG